MRRVVSVYLPTWPTDLLRARARSWKNRHGRPGSGSAPDADKPFVIASTGAQRVITAVDMAAHRLDLRRGIPLAHARAMVPDLTIADADPDADAEGLHRLALWALRYSPMVAVDPSDGLWIDITGASHLVGGERPLLDDLVGRLAGMGVASRAAVAGTPGAANAIARFGHRPVCVVDDALEVVSALPLAALRLPPEMTMELRRLGFETIGDLEATPRAPLAHRFGTSLGRRLDQVFGRVAEPIVPVIPTEAVQARRSLVEPISTAEALQTVVGALVTDLCGQLEQRGLGARTLDLLWHRVDGTMQGIRVGTAKPVRNAVHLTRLLNERVDKVDPGFGIEAAVLTATLAEPLTAEEVGRLVGAETDLAASDDAATIAGLIDVLGNRIGHDRLYRCAPLESDVPERSVARIPALAPPVPTGWPTQWPRPGRLLSPPEPIETLALMPDHPPMAFTWRGVRRLIRRADGPERIHGEWWRRDREMAAARDYYAVEDHEGERFWLYRSWEGSPETGPMRWYLHGLFG
ncbi:DNA polymerase Y family protein (plasmid) [Azospirillum oryzae]|uniref:DNA-directed DNA polymerase n=1 Tax=Azospirillum oryzae TaxID=286727 RepID=A0A6N1AF30_9PROT|nr:DNA polymerase Y family protein [Azospirillum oryzae]KAA0588810.1 DNA polymerase Y family protein [Azospirillum oryzae]QKS50156.1 DNA polymerase Y family protein [Azospirillum oryzae]GLR80278.1 nucleotidyltransferase [Azospirillum oryzae]